MNNPDDDFVDFTDEPAAEVSVEAADPVHESLGRKVWRVLIVDDDEDVHQATEFSLGGLRIHDRPLEFLHARSSLEAIDILMDQKNVAVILLDVVMENEDAGLAAVGVIRRDLGLGNVQIILRTGQPGYAPEIDTIRRYDINDYRTKAELTRTKLYTAVTAGIRVYDQLTRLDSARKALEQVALTSSELISENDREGFLSGILRRSANILMTSQAGFVVSGVTPDDRELRVKAATGEFVAFVDRPLAEVGSESARNAVAIAFASQRTIIDDNGTTLFFPGGRQAGCAAHFPASEDAPPVERRLLDVFCNVVAACRENLALVDELTSYAYVDPLTRLGSRRAFIRAIEERLDAVPDARGKISIALIDVDQFAEINDAFGHAYGDRLLLAIAARLRENLDAGCFISRIGNDIFGVVGKSEQVRPEALRPLFHLPFSIDGDERPIAVSMAFVNAGIAEGGGVALLKDATIVLKRAKSGGFARAAHYTAEAGAEIRDRTHLLDQLRNGIRNAELFLMYQPQIDLASGRVVGVEALMRWRNSQGELIPPDRFIPVAEQSGLILQLGTWALDTALGAASEIARSGHGGIRVAVNVSAAQFRQGDLVETVERVLREHAVPADLLELEITESVALMGINDVADQLVYLRQLGVAIAIDDFGTGYSSLSYLDRLPADRLKIDRAFVWALDAGHGGARIAEMVVPLGRSVNMKVLAEGVETEAQAERLRQLGCDEVQGYLYARPMLLDDLLAWLEAR